MKKKRGSNDDGKEMEGRDGDSVIVVAPMNRRQDQSVEEFILEVLGNAASFSERSAINAAPATFSKMGASEESHVAAYKQGFADGFNEARDVVAVLFAEMAVYKP